MEKGYSTTNPAPGWQQSETLMSDKDFKRFSKNIYDICGVKLPPSKKVMLASRLQRRLRLLGINSYRHYFDFVFSPEGRRVELNQMIDAVSTNKTQFFREEKHFDVLCQVVLPEIVKRLRKGNRRTINIWSAGCSSGEEPYTLAMIIDDFLKLQQNFDFKILGTDINTQVLKTAGNAAYANDLLEPIPAHFLRRYMMRGKGKSAGLHKIVPELRRKVDFQRLNFMDNNFNLHQKMDIIFCRNVIIYFDQPTQIILFEKFYRQFLPGGFLFHGHSESLEGINDRMERIAAATYRCKK